MFSNLYLLAGYNNYINRTLKYEDSIADYIDGTDSISFTNVNFNPNDEVTTEQILNVSDGATYDYLVVQNQGDSVVTSRWFVIDRTRIREGQWKLFLKRDVVADYWNVIRTAPCFIEKATLSPNDPRIFNKEDMTFNQIKQKEILIKDLTGCPWIVGYYSPSFTVKDNNVDVNYMSGTLKPNLPSELEAVEIGTPIDEWFGGAIYNASNYNSYDEPIVYKNVENSPIEMTIRNTFDKDPLLKDYAIYRMAFNRFNNFSLYSAKQEYNLKTAQDVYWKNNNEVTRTLEAATDYVQSRFRTNTTAIYNNVYPYFNDQDMDELKSALDMYKGKTIIDANNEIYTLDYSILTKTTTERTNINNTSALGEALKKPFSNAVGLGNFRINNGTSYGYNMTFAVLNVETLYYKVELTRRTDLEIRYKIDPTNAIKTEDAPYNIFAIPMGTIDIYDSDNDDSYVCSTSRDIAIQLAFDLNRKFPGIIYDIQILPYCPVYTLTYGGEREMYIDGNNTKQFSFLETEADDEKVGIIFNVPRSRFTFNLDFNYLTDNSISWATTSIEKKVNNECDKWRFCSPNYSNYFDFSMEMNGPFRNINVDCEYKPYTPYIHINPEFGELYGSDFNDPRGLVCGGDFSIAQIIDQWQQYQIQNKNFQNIFDRQIENMEVVNKAQNRSDIANAIIGALGGGAAGATMASMIPGVGVAGTVAGGLLGGVGSAVAGITDIKMNQMLRNEAIDFTRDQFGYQLGNIQALPTTLSRISAFNNNNKLFPVLEYYTCTDIEKEALRNKIKYNGMTVGTIGTIADFITNEETYIKGKLIKLPLISDDFHVANTIVEEINKGLYIGGM